MRDRLQTNGLSSVFHVTPDDFIPSLSLSDIEKINALLRIKHSDKIPPEEVKQAVMGGKDVVKPLVESKMFKGKNPRKCSFCSVVKDKDLLVCSRCKLVYYCGRQCQKQAWPAHKRFCKL